MFHVFHFIFRLGQIILMYRFAHSDTSNFISVYEAKQRRARRFSLSDPFRTVATMSQQLAENRRGPFRAGERVQLTDPKGRQYTISLTRDGCFHSNRGTFRHSELIGQDEGTVLHTEDGRQFLALRPLVSDYVLSMPRGATVIYPKDAAQIVHLADVFPGARVFEAGVGSGALSLSLLAAIGDQGHLLSAEVRPEFAEIARGNVTSWYGDSELPWEIEIGDAALVLRELERGTLDHVLLDMLAPWEIIDSAASALRPGGVILAYVATTTQMSRFVETLRDTEAFTEPQASETLVRTWHLDGLAVRPDHRMVAHTGFLVVARKLSPNSQPLNVARRPAKGAHSEALEWENTERTISPKKLRRVRRDVAHRSDVEISGESTPGEHGQAINQKIAEELASRANDKLEGN